MLRLAAVLLALLVLVPPAAPASAPRAWVDPAIAAADPAARLTLGLGFDHVPSADEARAIQARVPAIFYPHLPAAVAFARAQDVDALLDAPGLLSIVLDVPARTLALPEAQQGNFGGTGDAITRADLARAMGFDGKGVGLAVIDLGASGLHPGLRPRALGGPLVQNVKVLVSPDHLKDDQPADVPVTLYVENVTDSDMTDGHGTHTAAIAAGSWTSDGLFGGRAPGADLVTIGTGDALALPWILGGWEWVLAHREAYHIRIVSNSYGVEGPFNPVHPLQLATRAASDAGILVLFSAGNNGPGERTMNTYAQAPWVVAVGSTTLAGAMATSSSRGDAESGKPGPDLVAPGVEIISGRNQPVSGNEVTYRTPWTDSAYVPPEHLAWYRAISGTSMACPQVAGIAALVMQANPNLTAQQVRAILESTARPLVGYEYVAQGHGMVDAQAAILAALGQPTPPRDYVQPTVRTWDGTTIVYPYHGALLGGPDKSAGAFRPRQAFPVHLPAQGATLTFSWSSAAPLPLDPADGLVLSLFGADGALASRVELAGAEGSHTFVLDAADLVAHADPRWSAAYWTLVIDMDAGAIVYDVEARVTYATAQLPEVAHNPPAPPVPLPPRLSHRPIVIASDADFTAANGVTRGSGTIDDPYVIEGWDIAPGSGNALAIGGTLGTTKHVLIQNVHLHDTKTNCLNLDHVAHVTVRVSQLDGCDFALNAKGVTDLGVDENVVASSHHGIAMYGVQGARITGNTIREMGTDAIVVGQGLTQQSTVSTDVVLEDNTLLGPESLIILSSPGAIGTVLRRNAFGEGAFLDFNLLPARATISETLWLQGSPRYVSRVLTVTHPDPLVNAIVDAGSDRAAAPGATVCFGDARADVQAPESATSLVWDFGDGATGSGLHPCHAYDAAGRYTARLSALLASPDGASRALHDTVAVVVG